MPHVHQLSLREARRVAVRAQLLDAERPSSLMEVARRLTLLQLDPTRAVAPNADLVLWSRLGSAYDPAELRDALQRRQLLELGAMLRPAEDLALYRAEMAALPVEEELRDWERHRLDWVRANDGCRRDILRRLRDDGPLPSRELPDTCVLPWQSTGWTNNKNVIRLLDFMVQRGEVAVAGRRGRDRLWDLADRVYPDEPAVPPADARRERDRRRLRALGIARPRTQVAPGERWDVGEAGEVAVVEGLSGEWRVHAEHLEDVGRPFRGRVALLSPFDRLVHDRARLSELFGFDYQLEMYKPAAKRRWGYFALPVLYGDLLVGKLDASADRKAGVLRVHALHEDEPLSDRMRAEIRRESEDLARWLGLDLAPPGFRA